MCLAASAIGKEHRLYDERPVTFETLTRHALPFRSEVIDADGQATGETSEHVAGEPAVMRVEIAGVIEQRAGYHGECSSWTDGHDAIAERLISALEMGDVLLVVDSPGGAAAGLQEAVRRVLAEKAEHGRTITGWVDEQCASAALWWAASVCDTLYLPEAGQVGSIGARSGHMSVAGALAKEGLEPTFFVWPGPGKVAYAPELPLSDVARARGERDVSICGEAFASAMVAARAGLTREAIVELDADCLTGELAVSAHLADGVSTYEEVLRMALAQAGAGEDAMAIESETPDPKSPEDAVAARGARTEEDPPADDPEADGGMKPSPDCANCGMRNKDTAKFCDQCGESMAAKGAVEDPPADTPADAPGKPPAPKPPTPDSHSASHSASIATMLGLPANASAPAVRTALVPYLSLATRAMKLTDTRSPAKAMGALQSLADDAGETGDLRTRLAAAEKREAWDKRMVLCRKLAAADLPGYPRGDILVDKVAQDGTRTVQPAKVYAEMNLDTLDGLVTGKLASRAPGAPDAPRRNPFQPPAPPAEKVPGAVTVTEADRVTAAKFGMDPERVAQSRHAIQLQNVTPPHATNGAS